MRPSLNLQAEVPRDLNQLRQHSQLGAMGVGSRKRKAGSAAEWLITLYGKIRHDAQRMPCNTPREPLLGC